MAGRMDGWTDGRMDGWWALHPRALPELRLPREALVQVTPSSGPLGVSGVLGDQEAAPILAFTMETMPWGTQGHFQAPSPQLQLSE